jgi:hypothetical protein
MEEKDLQAGEPLAETKISGENSYTTQQSRVVEMAASEPLGEEAVKKDPASEPSARERLKGSVLEEKKTAKASDFMRPGGLFEGYEITNAKEMPLFIRVFAASALAHLVIFAAALQLPAVVQTTCDSTEFTQQLCDTMYVASLLSNSDRSFADKDYDPTQIPDAENGVQEVVFINDSDFTYPEGYWTLRDELEGRTSVDDLAMVSNSSDPTLNPTMHNLNAAPGFNTAPSASSPGSSMFGRKQVLPKHNPKAFVETPEDDSASTASPQGGQLTGGGRKVTESGNSNGGGATTNAGQPKNPTTTTATAQSSEPAEDIYNKKPLYDLLDKMVDFREVQQNNFYQPFQYSIAGTIDKDGKLVTEGVPTFNGVDPKMQEIVKASVAAFSDSGMFKLLTDIQSKKVKITFVQDGNQFNVKLETEQESERKAKGLFNVFNIALGLGKNSVSSDIAKELKQNDPKRAQKEQVTLDLLNKANLRRDGNIIIIEAAVDNSFAESMYQTYKKDLDEKKNQPGNSTLSTNGSGGVK